MSATGSTSDLSSRTAKHEEFKATIGKEAANVINVVVPQRVLQLHQLAQELDNFEKQFTEGQLSDTLPMRLQGELAVLIEQIKAIQLALSITLPSASAETHESVIQKQLACNLNAAASRCHETLKSIHNRPLAKISEEIYKHPDVEDFKVAHEMVREDRASYLYKKWAHDLEEMAMILENFLRNNSDYLPVLFEEHKKQQRARKGRTSGARKEQRARLRDAVVFKDDSK